MNLQNGILTFENYEYGPISLMSKVKKTLGFLLEPDPEIQPPNRKLLNSENGDKEFTSSRPPYNSSTT